MKKFKKLLVVVGLLMSLGLVIPAAIKGNASSNDNIKVCSDWPAADTMGIV